MTLAAAERLDDAALLETADPSGTEPLLRLNVEASDEPTLAAVRDEALRIVRGGGQRPPRTWETP